MTQLVVSLALMFLMLLFAGRWASAKQRRQREMAEATGPTDSSEVRHARHHR
jgi:hypothetical protein